MAEEIKTYQRQLRPGLNIPQMDTSAQREQARYYQQLAQSLSSMTDFFFKAHDNIMKIEGAEYGPSVAPTGQQLTDAMAMPDDTAEQRQARDTAIEAAQADMSASLGGIGDSFSTFGTAARASAFATTYNDLSMAAKKQIIEAKVAANLDPLNPANAPDAILANFESMINGYAGVFDEESPAYARKFRAELNLYAYGEYESISKNFNTEVKVQMANGFEASFQTELDSIATWFEVGMPYIYDEENQVYAQIKEGEPTSPPTKELLATVLKQAQAKASAVGKGTEYIKQMETRWNEAILDAVKGDASMFIINYANNHDRAVGFNQLEGAILESKNGGMYKTKADGSPDSAFLSLPKNLQNAIVYYQGDEEALMEIRAAAKTQLTEALTLQNSIHNEASTARGNSVEFEQRKVIETIVSREIDSIEKTRRIRESVQKIMLLDRAKGNEMMQMLEDLVGPQFDLYGREAFAFRTLESNGELIARLDKDLAHEPAFVKTTQSSLLKEYKDGNLTYKDLQAYSEKLAAVQSTEGQEILKRVRSALRMPANLILDQRHVSQANLALYGRIENRLAEAMRSGDFDAGAFMTDVLGIIEEGRNQDNLYVNISSAISLSGLGVTFSEWQRNYQMEMTAPGTSNERKLELRELYQDILDIQQSGNAAQLNEQLPGFFND